MNEDEMRQLVVTAHFHGRTREALRCFTAEAECLQSAMFELLDLLAR